MAAGPSAAIHRIGAPDYMTRAARSTATSSAPAPVQAAPVQQARGPAPIPFDASSIRTPEPVAAPSAPNISATISPQLEALSGKYDKYVSDLETNTGHSMDVMGNKFRDIREGGRKALMDRNAIAGRNSATGVQDYDAETSRGVQAEVAKAGLDREVMRGSALSGAVAAAKAPLDTALAEKGLGLSAYNAHNSAVNAANATNSANFNNAYNQMVSLLEYNRSSPVYYAAGV